MNPYPNSLRLTPTGDQEVEIELQQTFGPTRRVEMFLRMHNDATLNLPLLELQAMVCEEVARLLTERAQRLRELALPQNPAA